MEKQTLHCSPLNYVKYGSKDGTCYSLKDLRAIAREYNKLSQDKIPLDLPKKDLHESLEKAFRSVCKDELCWISTDKVRISDRTRTELRQAFRPQKPLEWYDDRRTWLNTYDIIFVMQQYQLLYKDFEFLGVYPIDFANYDNFGKCIGDNLCTMNVRKFTKERFAIVLNLDYHDEPGSHWVSIYCNLNPKKENYGIYYYDSVASDPPEEVVAFMDKVAAQVSSSRKSKLEFVKKYNKIQKQFKNTECGAFSIIFLTQCLKDVPFDFICKNMKTDDEINKLRDVLYSPNMRKYQNMR
jgi:hypothetical protein